MKVDIVQRRLIQMTDGRILSLHPGEIECDDELAKELLSAGLATKPKPKPKLPLIASSEVE